MRHADFAPGVDRAIQIVELALEKYGAPVYVRHAIVHNKYVVEGLRQKGAVFVEELDEIPATGAPVVFSAHGVPKSVPADARERATCSSSMPPARWSRKVHIEAQRQFNEGREIILIGHAGHVEVIGTMGQLPEGAITLVQTVADAEAFQPRDPEKLAYVTQTTLSVDDTERHRRSAAAALPGDRAAAQGRHLLRDHQPAGSGQAGGAERRRDDRGGRARIVELGAAGGSGAARWLRARHAGRAGRPDRLEPRSRASRTLGITAGASAPETLVDEVIEAFAQRFDIAVAARAANSARASSSTCRANCGRSRRA